MEKPPIMKKCARIVILMAMFCLMLALSDFRWAAQPLSVFVTNEFPVHIVTCEDGVDVDALLKENGVTPRHRYRYALNGFAAPLPPGLIEKLRRDKRVLSVEADVIANVCDQTVPPGISRIGADTFPIGRSNGVAIPIDVGVAILDSGIDPHPDLNIYSNYWAFSSDGSDSLAHGTSVAGVLAAQANGYGVVGVAPGAKVWNVKCIGPFPFNAWTLTDKFALDSNFSPIPRTNSLVANVVLSPGQTIDVAAPGVNILTTGFGGNYVIVSGTSFAAPHVTGLVALYVAANGRAS